MSKRKGTFHGRQFWGPQSLDKMREWFKTHRNRIIAAGGEIRDYDVTGVGTFDSPYRVTFTEHEET